MCKKSPLKIKGKFYKTVVRAAIMYGFEFLAINKKERLKVDVAEVRMQRYFV